MNVKINVDYAFFFVWNNAIQEDAIMKENKYLEYKKEINDNFLKTVSAFAKY